MVFVRSIPLPKRSVFSCLSADIVADNDVSWHYTCNRIVSLAAILLGFLNNSTDEPAGTGIK
jgi:membrane-bound lytic murein transglycosylase MltF